MASTASRHPSTDEDRSPRERVSIDIDRDKLQRAVAILGTSSESEAIDQALDRVLYDDELVQGMRRIAGTGGVENYFDDHPGW